MWPTAWTPRWMVRLCVVIFGCSDVAICSSSGPDWVLSVILPARSGLELVGRYMIGFTSLVRCEVLGVCSLGTDQVRDLSREFDPSLLLCRVSSEAADWVRPDNAFMLIVAII